MKVFSSFKNLLQEKYQVSLGLFSAYLMVQVITLSITGALNAVLSEEHKKEMCRYLYNHQVRTSGALSMPFSYTLQSVSEFFSVFCCS